MRDDSSGSERSEEEARVSLRALLGKVKPSTCTWQRKVNQILHNKMLDVLTSHQSCLAKEKFETCISHKYDCLSPLSILLCDGATKDTLEAIYKLYPHTLSEPSERGKLPLHYACEFGTEDTVIEFIIDNFPPASFVRDREGYLPIHIAMEQSITRQASFRTLAALVKVFPGSVWEPMHCSTPLDCAFNFRYSQNVLNLFLEQIPSSLAAFQLSKDCFLSLEAAQSISNYLLPRLTQFTCLARSQSIEAFQHIMDCLQQNESIAKLSFVLPRYVFSEGGAAFSKMLQENKAILDITFLGAEPRLVTTAGFEHDRCIHPIMEGLQSSIMQRDSLTLTDFALSDSALLSDLLCSPNIPTTVSLSNVRISGESLNSSISWSKSFVEDLNLHLCHMEYSFVADILSRLNLLPNLRALSFGATFLHEGILDVTEPICALLFQNRLFSLTIDNDHNTLILDMKSVCGALEHNHTLKYLDVYWALESKEGMSYLVSLLDNHNVTLNTVPITTESFRSPMGQKIQYYTKLNRYGREVARESDTNLSDLIFLLSEAVTATSAPFADGNILFGLLRETPALWSGGS